PQLDQRTQLVGQTFTVVLQPERHLRVVDQPSCRPAPAGSRRTVRVRPAVPCPVVVPARSGEFTTTCAGCRPCNGPRFHCGGRPASVDVDDGASTAARAHTRDTVMDTTPPLSSWTMFPSNGPRSRSGPDPRSDPDLRSDPGRRRPGSSRRSDIGRPAPTA